MTTTARLSITLRSASADMRAGSLALVPIIWLFARLLLGVEWLRGAQEKIGAPGWTAEPVGGAITGFINGALAKATGAHPEVGVWFAPFAQHVVMPHPVLFAYLVTFGELLVGIALILGLCTRFAALSGAFLNFMFLTAGTSSTNPQMLVLELAIVLVGARAGAYGLDRWVMPYVERIRGRRATSTAVLIVPAGLAAAALGYIGTDATTWLTCLGVAALVGLAVIGLRHTNAIG